MEIFIGSLVLYLRLAQEAQQHILLLHIKHASRDVAKK